MVLLAADSHVEYFGAGCNERHQCADGCAALFLPEATGGRAVSSERVYDAGEARLAAGNYPQLTLSLLGLFHPRSGVTHFRCSHPREFA